MLDMCKGVYEGSFAALLNRCPICGHASSTLLESAQTPDNGPWDTWGDDFCQIMAKHGIPVCPRLSLTLAVVSTRVTPWWGVSKSKRLNSTTLCELPSATAHPYLYAGVQRHLRA